MSNEQTGKLIDDVAATVGQFVARYMVETVSVAIVGELLAKYRIEPLENTVEEEKT